MCTTWLEWPLKKGYHINFSVPSLMGNSSRAFTDILQTSLTHVCATKSRFCINYRNNQTQCMPWFVFYEWIYQCIQVTTLNSWFKRQLEEAALKKKKQLSFLSFVLLFWWKEVRVKSEQVVIWYEIGVINLISGCQAAKWDCLSGLYLLFSHSFSV